MKPHYRYKNQTVVVQQSQASWPFTARTEANLVW